MSTSGPDAPAADDDVATVTAADERNDNEAARDAAATALWTRCLEHAGTSPRDQRIPTHVAVLKDIHGADYSTLLKCPLDDRTEHPYGQKGERKLAATGALTAAGCPEGGAVELLGGSTPRAACAAGAARVVCAVDALDGVRTVAAHAACSPPSDLMMSLITGPMA